MSKVSPWVEASLSQPERLVQCTAYLFLPKDCEVSYTQTSGKAGKGPRVRMAHAAVSERKRAPSAKLKCPSVARPAQSLTRSHLLLHASTPNSSHSALVSIQSTLSPSRPSSPPCCTNSYRWRHADRPGPSFLAVHVAHGPSQVGPSLIYVGKDLYCTSD